MGVSHYKISQAQQLSLEKSNSLKNQSSLTDGIQFDISEISHYVENFELNNDSNGLATFNEKSEKAKKNLLEIKNLMRSDNDRILIGNIEENLARYQYNFQTAIKVAANLGLNEKSGLLAQFNNKMMDIANVVTNAKDEKLTEKFLLLQNLQDSYLKDTVTTSDQVIVAQKNFLDRVNRSAGDYETVSKMMVQTISLMQSFELMKNSFEEKRFLIKQVNADQLKLQTDLKQLSEINQQYQIEDEKLNVQTEQQTFILFLIAISLVVVSVISAPFLLKRRA